MTSIFEFFWSLLELSPAIRRTIFVVVLVLAAYAGAGLGALMFIALLWLGFELPEFVGWVLRRGAKE